jgi:hypothetical protein
MLFFPNIYVKDSANRKVPRQLRQWRNRYHRADGSVAWRMGKIAEPTKTPDAALGELSAVYTLPRYKISSDMKRQGLIAILLMKQSRGQMRYLADFQQIKQRWFSWLIAG